MAFEWKNGYSVGIAEIDKQHKKLFEIGNRIYETAQLQDNIDHFDEIVAILDELKHYAQYHFAYEEELMEKCNFADLETHKIEHYFFTKKIQKVNLEELDSAQDQALMKLLDFTASWITEHILNTDKKYIKALKSCDISKSSPSI